MDPGPAILIPAAGASTRFGSPKQLARVRDRAMLATVVDRALESGHGPIAVVLGAHANEIMPMLQDKPVTVVINDAWREGLSSSIRVGVRSLLGSPGILIWLGDQLAVTVADLRRLIAAWDDDRSRVAASRYDGTVGVPAILPSSEYADLLALRGDRGARHLLRSRSGHTTIVDMANAAIDIDAPMDLETHAARLD